MPVFAAVDIGSNSVRLSIARLHKGKLVKLHEDREVTRLGEGVFRSRTLDPQAMAQTIKVLRRFHKAVQSYGVDQVRVVGTSASRDARNAKVFADWVSSSTGWKLDVISGVEEGRLIHLGVLSSLRTRAQRLLLIDLGGGSCELTISDRGHIQSIVSLPLGAVRLTQHFLAHDPPKTRELERMRAFIEEEVARAATKTSKARIELVIATSGTAAALAGAAAHMAGRGPGDKKGMVSRRAVAELAERLASMRLEQRIALPGINAKRAEIIVAGATVFAGIFTRCNLRGFRYSPLGLRDGILAQMAAEADVHALPHKQIESDREDAMRSICERYNVNRKQAVHVRHLALSLFRGLHSVHELPADYADWLGAAAMLADVGDYVNRAGKYRHTYYILAHSDIFGYAERQRQIIAAIARYQGNSKPEPADRIIKQLPAVERDRVIKSVVLLRLARALDLGDRRAVKQVRALARGPEVKLSLKTARGGAELELWAAERESNYFREIFGRRLSTAIS